MLALLALWKKSLREVRWLLLAAGLVLIAFMWMRVWMISQLPTASFRGILKLRPAFAERLSPVPWDELAGTLGRLATGYNDALVVLILTVWGIGRGSDAVAGEIGRGTMELLLAQPVRRITVLTTQAAVTLLGAALLAACTWAGTLAGIASVELEEPVQAMDFAPAVLNLFALAAFLAGVSTLVSSFGRSRGRVIGVLGGLYVHATVAKIVSRVNPTWEWLGYTSFFSAFEPTRLVLRDEQAWLFVVHSPGDDWQLGGLGFSGILLGLGAASYVLAAVIFCHRDLPAPL